MSELKWLKNWLTMRNHGATISDTTNYIDEELIDSFGMIELIEEIESHFGIRLNERVFEDNTIFTVNGLATIIKDKLSKKA